MNSTLCNSNEKLGEFLKSEKRWWRLGRDNEFLSKKFKLFGNIILVLLYEEN